MENVFRRITQIDRNSNGLVPRLCRNGTRKKKQQK
jgi:hypothetical protein